MQSTLPPGMSIPAGRLSENIKAYFVIKDEYAPTNPEVNMQTRNAIWPDKSSFDHLLTRPSGTGRLKRFRDLPCSQPGVTARLVEFDRKFLDRPYRDPRIKPEAAAEEKLELSLEG
jgi:hypothetical protein